MVHSGPDCLDHASHFVTKDASIRRFAGIQRERFKHVAEVHSCSFHLDQHLPNTAGGQGERREKQCVQVTAFTGLESQRYSRTQPFLLEQATTREALNVASFSSKRNLTLGILTQKLTPQQRLV